MKNETIILVVAFIGILYLMFHHNQAIAGTPTNVSPGSITPGSGLGGGGTGKGTTYAPPTPLQMTNPNAPPTSTYGQPTCTAGSCGGTPNPNPPPTPIYGGRSQIYYGSPLRPALL